MKNIFIEFKPECVFHLAANADIGKSAHDASVDLTKTFATTISVLEAMKASEAKQIIFSSSSVVYGELPGPVTESSGPLLPISNYGAAKLSSEAFISSYADTYGFRAWIFRFANICGPRISHGVFVNFLRFIKEDPTRITVAQDGTQAKPYVYVEDLIDAIMIGWKNGKEKINIFNAGNSPLVSVNEILDIILKEKGIPKIQINYTHEPAWAGDIKTYAFDNTKLESLGFHPKYNSLEAVTLTIQKIADTLD